MREWLDCYFHIFSLWNIFWFNGLISKFLNLTIGSKNVSQREYVEGGVPRSNWFGEHKSMWHSWKLRIGLMFAQVVVFGLGSEPILLEYWHWKASTWHLGCMPLIQQLYSKLAKLKNPNSIILLHYEDIRMILNIFSYSKQGGICR